MTYTELTVHDSLLVLNNREECYNRTVKPFRAGRSKVDHHEARPSGLPNVATVRCRRHRHERKRDYVIAIAQHTKPLPRSTALAPGMIESVSVVS